MVYNKIKIGIVPVRRDIFNESEALAQKNQVFEALKHYDADFVNIDDVASNGIACSGADAEPIAGKLRDKNVDGVFFLHCDFGTEGIVARIAMQFNLPFLLWGSCEGEIVNDQLVRYTQTGVYATGKALLRCGKPFDYIISSPVNSVPFERGMDNFIRVCGIMRAMRSMAILQISTRPEPFWSVMTNEGELLERFGIRVVPMELSEFVGNIRQLVDKKDERIEAAINETKKQCSCDEISKDQLDLAMSMLVVLEEYFVREGYNAAAIQCWSAMQDMLGIMPCATFGLLTDAFLPVACETDVKGAISSVLLQEATLRKTPTFFADVTVRHPENKNSNLLWHCGNFPPSLAKQGSDLKLSNHPIQPPHPGAIGEWELQKGDITICRFDEAHGKYYLLAGEARAVSGPKVNGTYVWIETDNWAKWEERLVKGPYIHHVSCVYENAASALYASAKYMDVCPDMLNDGIEAYLRGE